MHCTSCGSEMQLDTHYCACCGSLAVRDSRTHVGAISVAAHPLMTVKPRFVPLVSIASALPLQIFLTLWGALFLGGAAIVGLGPNALGLPGWALFVITGSLFFFGVPIVVYINKKRAYENTEFRFYDRKLDYHEGLFTTEEKSIDYDTITATNLRRGLIQKMCGLGTIVLSAPQTQRDSEPPGRDGVIIVDISNPESTYQRVKALLKRF